jgi:muramoyltetrapeptide carboxypeptidase
MTFSRKSFLTTSLMGLSSLIFGKKNKEFIVQSSTIKPKKLPKNATIGLIAPASPIYGASIFNTMIDSLNTLGYNIVLGNHVNDRNGYLAGKDEDRVSDLHDMFANDIIDGIICVRGGYGSNRILDLINFDIIKENPKPFIGFSDITSLHLAIYEKTGLITFHGPVGKSDWNPYTLDSWNSILHHAKNPTYYIPEGDENQFTIGSGSSKGKLLGGNLTVLTSLLGSNYLPPFEGAILFLEDIGEDVYRVDRMLSQLALNGILSKLNGFVFGKCTDCEMSTYSLSLNEVLDHYIKPLDIPAFYGAMISHEEQNLTIPVGIQASIDADNRTISILESSVQ